MSDGRPELVLSSPSYATVVLGDIPINGIHGLYDLCFTPAKGREGVMGRFDLSDFEWSVIQPL
ncbi:MAG: hypothetical protein WAU13_11925, partial [Albidovulum sp.]